MKYINKKRGWKSLTDMVHKAIYKIFIAITIFLGAFLLITKGLLGSLFLIVGVILMLRYKFLKESGVWLHEEVETRASYQNRQQEESRMLSALRNAKWAK